MSLRSVEALKWALRRFELPVSRSALVLEVGSGGNPYPRSNVLLDAYTETRERHWEPLIHDRPTVLAFGENLPFKDKSFDFVIAAHVLEHAVDPEKFLTELERVALAGYIETPDAFMERINPYKDHRHEVTVRNNMLLIRKKMAWVVDQELVDLYENRAKQWVTRELMPQHPQAFHVRYWWKDKINFRIINPETDASWQPVAGDLKTQPHGIKQGVRRFLLDTCRAVFSQKQRNKNIDLLVLLRCPCCHATALVRHKNGIMCQQCQASFEIQQNVFVMHTSKGEL